MDVEYRLIKQRDERGFPVVIEVLDPADVTVVYHEDGRIAGYLISRTEDPPTVKPCDCADGDPECGYTQAPLPRDRQCTCSMYAAGMAACEVCSSALKRISE